MERWMRSKAFQKHTLILFCLLLIFSPFGSLGEMTHAEEKSDESIEGEIKTQADEIDPESEENDVDKEKEATEQKDGQTNKKKQEDEEEKNEKKKSGDNLLNEKEKKEKKQDSHTKEKSEEVEDESEAKLNDLVQIQANSESDFEWEDNTDGTVKITGYKGNETELDIPATLGGKDVTVIGEYVFAGKNLTHVVIPNTVKRIHVGAFRDNNLTTVSIPASVESLSMVVFEKNNLKSVQFHEGIVTIGQQAFNHNELESIEFPDSLRNIPQFAFNNNETLTDVKLNYGLEKIDYRVFYGASLTKVEIPETVTSISNQAFGNNKLEEVIVNNHETQFGDDNNTFIGNQDNPEDLVIFGHDPSTAKEYADVNSHTFYSMLKVQMLNPDEIPLDKWVDYGTKQEDIGLPDTVHVNMFHGGSKNHPIVHELPVEWDDGDPVYNSQKAGIYTFTGTLVLEPGMDNSSDVKVVIDVTVEESDGFEWDYNSDGTVTITGFNGTEKAIEIPATIDGKDVTTIGRRAFMEKGLTSVVLPEGLKNLGVEPFFDNNLTEISIPASLENIGSAPFRENKLEKVVVHPDNETYKDVNEQGLYTKDGKVLIVGTTAGIIEEGTETIHYSAFGKYGLTEITIPNTVTTIMDGAFQDNELEQITIPESVTTIGQNAFQNNHLQEISIPESITRIDRYVFSRNKLKTIELSDQIKSIGVYAFERNQIEAVHLPKNLETISQHAFYFNELQSIDIPASVNSIDKYAFAYNKINEAIIHNPSTLFQEGIFETDKVDPEDVTIKGFAGSTAETYANGNNHQFEAFIVTIDSVDTFADIEVPYGTEQADLPLPEEVEVVVDINGSQETYNLDVNWDNGTPQYDGNEAGNYTFTGELQLETSFVNPNNLTAEVKVTVLPQEYEWEDNGDGTVTITGYIGSDTEIVIPHTIDGKDVTIIGEGAFEERGVTSVVIPNSVTRIELKSFFRNKINSLTLSNNLEYIGVHAFSYNSLENIDIPESVNQINSYAFLSNDLTVVDIPSNVTSIGAQAFAYNELKQIVVPSNVEKLYGDAFYHNKINTAVIENETMEFVQNPFRANQDNSEDLIIIGHSDSTAETYANEYNYTFDPFVLIPDHALKKAINNALNKGESYQPTKNDLENLTELNAYQASISDLTGLQYATNLTKLHLESNHISDISVLASLGNLESIDLAGNDISDISPVKNLHKLETLLVGRNDINDISDLENMENLTFLELSYNDIGDITPLTSLTNLEVLLLSKISVTDFSALKDLKHLKALSLDDNKFNDISLLENFPNLIWLDLENNDISDLSVLEQLTNLEVILLAHNKISDLSPLGSYFNQLQDGSLHGQEITLPPVQVLNTATNLEIDNPITFHDGSIIEDLTVQDGTYDSPKIKWDLTGTETERVFTFEERVYGFAGTVTQPIEWVVDEEPVIHATDRTILLNEPFDPLDGVTATDKESGDLTSDIQVIKNEVDISQVGAYEVIYEVTDHGGQTVTKTITVTVTELDVTAIETVSDISVAFGTEKNDLGLPEQINVELTNGSTEAVPVTWNDGNPVYDPLETGTYTFTGTLQLQAGIANSNNLTATISIHVDEFILPVDGTVQTEVFAGMKATIVGTNTTITFPANLPTGTLLTIVDVSEEGFVTGADGIEVAGDVLDFIFEYPTGENFSGNFILTMIYNDDAEEDVDIFYYNEQDKAWEAKNGQIDRGARTITIQPTHFSVYGAFSLLDSDDDNGKDSGDGDEDSEDPGNGDDDGQEPIDGDEGDDPSIIIDDVKDLGRGGPGEVSTKDPTIEKTVKSILPKTATNMINIIIAGIALIILGSAIYVTIRRRTT